nr:hypothetical protein GCM10020185_65850 [Pseudomonas brassicacearum subsp. brassicacearum]
MPTVSHLLLVDDDLEVLALLRKFLEQHGYSVDVAADGTALWQAVERRVPDLIILDVMLPGDNGLVLCQRLRAEHTVGIIMLTAMGELSDRVVGLELGADDYLTKPFDARELLARVRAVLRRTGEARDTLNDSSRPILEFEKLATGRHPARTAFTGQGHDPAVHRGVRTAAGVCRTPAPGADPPAVAGPGSRRNLRCV